jgi:hypothetical protein
MYYPVPSHAQTQTHTPHAGIRVLAIVIARTARRVYMRACNFLHLAIRAVPCISIATRVPRTCHHHGCAHARPPLPGEWIPCHQRARIFTAHTACRASTPHKNLPRTQENQAGKEATRARTFAAAAPNGAAVAGPIPVKVSGERVLGIRDA